MSFHLETGFDGILFVRETYPLIGPPGEQTPEDPTPLVSVESRLNWGARAHIGLGTSDCRDSLGRITNHASVTRRWWMYLFAAFVRCLLAVGFIPPSIPKILGLPFTSLPESTTIGFLFNALPKTGPHYGFIGRLSPDIRPVRRSWLCDRGPLNFGSHVSKPSDMLT